MKTGDVKFAERMLNHCEQFDAQDTRMSDERIGITLAVFTLREIGVKVPIDVETAAQKASFMTAYAPLRELLEQFQHQ